MKVDMPATPGPDAARALELHLEELITQVNGRFEMDERFQCGSFPCALATMVRDLQVRFGRLLHATYEFGLLERLGEEFFGLVRPVLSRGASTGFPAAVLDAWLVALQTVPAHSDQPALAGPVATLRAGLPENWDAPALPALDAPAQKYLDLLLQGDRRRAADYTLNRAGGNRAVESTIDELTLPALTRVGELWATNKLNVAEEHRATMICRYVIYRVLDLVPPDPPNGHRALVACAPGEEHELGAELTAGLLELTGWQVFLVGRSAPPDELTVTARRFRPDVSLIGAATIASLPALQRLGGQLRAVIPGSKLIAGGRAAMIARSRLAETFDATVPTATEGRKVAEKLTG